MTNKGEQAIGGLMGDSIEQQQTTHDLEDNGLRFLNKDWNNSISNGELYTIRWNDTIERPHGELQLFKVGYPQDGEISFELVSNLTDSMEDALAPWTPTGLNENGLYAFWLTRNSPEGVDWAISPPWKAKQELRGFHWTAPIGIPIVVILGLYIVSLVTYIFYRRRTRRRTARERERERESEFGLDMQQQQQQAENTDRQGSFSSVKTAQTLTEDYVLTMKKGEGGEKVE